MGALGLGNAEADRSAEAEGHLSGLTQRDARKVKAVFSLPTTPALEYERRHTVPLPPPQHIQTRLRLNTPPARSLSRMWRLPTQRRPFESARSRGGTDQPSHPFPMAPAALILGRVGTETSVRVVHPVYRVVGEDAVRNFRHAVGVRLPLSLSAGLRCALRMYSSSLFGGASPAGAWGRPQEAPVV
eukprot:gene8591-6031_t